MHSALITPQCLLKTLEDNSILLIESLINPVGMQFKDIEGHLPGAVKMDLEEEFSDPNNPIPHSLLPVEIFEKQIRNLGVSQDSFVVIYDRQGLYSAPRAWWNFKSMGIENVFILDGGLPAWVASGFPVTSELSRKVEKGDIRCQKQKDRLVDLGFVRAALDQQDKKIIDARSASRFSGLAPEPRQGLPSGHMPNAHNLPFTECIDDGRLLPTAQLQALFTALGCTIEQQLIFTCGSGVTACIPLLAAYQCGYRNLSLYDGAWCEWAGSGQSIIGREDVGQ